MIYDIGIIGGGPAGYTAALEAATYGLSVILFEKADMGGTCLNRGCVPTRYLEQVAKSLRAMNTNSRYGIHVEKMCFDYREAHKCQQDIIHKLRDRLVDLIKTNNITLCTHEARIAAQGIINTDSESYTCHNIIVATGAVHRDILHPHAITSDEILELDELPEKLAILGGGVTAVEIADSYAAMGSDVTLFLRGPRILRHFDVDIARSAQQLLKQHGVKVQTKCDISELSFDADTTILSAAGMIPNINDNVVESSLLTLGDDGGIIVDSHGETNTKGIFAAGDVVSGSPQLAHVAMEQAKKIIRYIVTGAGETVRPVVSQCVYLTPEIASVGMTESDAKAAVNSVVSSKCVMYSNACTLISTGERGFIKIVADKDTEKILGAHLFCERASDMISEFALAIDKELTVNEFASSTRPHPTFAEAITESLDILKRKMVKR